MSQEQPPPPFFRPIFSQVGLSLPRPSCGPGLDFHWIKPLCALMTTQGRTHIRRINSSVPPSISPVIIDPLQHSKLPLPSELTANFHHPPKQLSPCTVADALTSSSVAYVVKLNTEKSIQVEQLSTTARLVFSPFAQC